jgi:NhaA family Na+:H+ antiporter
MPQKRINKLISPLRDFINDSRSSGIILITCTIASLTFSNLSFSQKFYTSFWGKHLKLIPLEFLNLPETVLLNINDVLMTLFFFLVGMEIKRELTIGELATIRKSLLPVLAAIGGMIFPALIFSVYNFYTDGKSGWGIPMATDIAFSLGVLSLLGKKVPIQLKIFLAALAIIDDLGAIITIAIFYTAKLNLVFLLIAFICVIVLFLLNKLKVSSLTIYAIPVLLLWYAVFNSGIHATIAGVIASFAIPLSSLSKLEHILYRPVNFVIMPLFALANTAIVFPESFADVFKSTISYGVILGLSLGKPLGIFFFSFISIKLKIASLPSNTTYKQLWGIGLLGGIGFTMSIFTSTLAYSNDLFQVISKVSVIAGSLIASVMGYAYLNGYSNAKDIRLEHPPVIRKTFNLPPIILPEIDLEPI